VHHLWWLGKVMVHMGQQVQVVLRYCSTCGGSDLPPPPPPSVGPPLGQMIAVQVREEGMGLV
jgi:hypothetical protein